jgi:NAD(P)H-hydrate repair Nnr-like enzyme with NAD(P)H-hydrate dehydratase domain
VFENKTGNPHMTVGGTGDTLAGILVSLLAQKVPPLNAARKAAEINGKAGDYCLKKEQRVLASHLIQYIPRFI